MILPRLKILAFGLSLLFTSTVFIDRASAQDAGTPPAEQSPAPQTETDEQPPPPEAEPAGNGHVNLVIGAGEVMNLPHALDRVALGDESLAEIKVLNPREILLHARKLGSSTLFIWMEGGLRERYTITVSRDFSTIQRILSDLDENIIVEDSADGRSIILRGTVDDMATAQEAAAQARRMLANSQAGPSEVFNLLGTRGEREPANPDGRLMQLMRSVDPRITVRRIRVGNVPGNNDSYILEGHVRTLQDLMKAINLADRQLGGSGGVISSQQDTRITTSRRNNFGTGLGATAGQAGFGNSNQRVDNGLATQLAKGMVLTSESGRVISFLEVDQLVQILVSIRAFEIDRNKARSEGINYRVDGSHFSLGVQNTPGSASAGFGGALATAAATSISTAGNVVGSYVSDTVRVLTAVDFLQSRNIARSVAEPNIMTLTGEQASISIGGEVPIQTSSLTDVALFNGFQFQRYGVQMDIRPTVDNNGIITLEVSPSIVRPDYGVSVNGVPGFQVQEVQTTARVASEQSLILGGLINYEEVLIERKVPILGDIPILSMLFKWKAKSRQERELMFVITPRIMQDAEHGMDPITLPGIESRENKRIMEQVEPQWLDVSGRPINWIPQSYSTPQEDGDDEEE